MSIYSGSMETSYLAIAEKVNHCGPLYNRSGSVAAASCFKTKHIAIRHHFIRDAYEKKLIQVLKIHTDDNVADLLTKAFDVWFNPPRDVSMSCLTTKGMRNNGTMCARHITAKVAGKFVSISEASIRTDLIFNDADGIHSLPNQAIFDAIKLMGYEGDITVLNNLIKPYFLPHGGRKLANISVPLDHFPVFSFMIKKGKHFSVKVTPLFDTMLVQATKDEGASSERLSDEQPSPSPTPTGEVPNESLPDSSSAQPKPTGENLGDHSSNDASFSGNEDDMTLQNVYDLCISLCQQEELSKDKRSAQKVVSKQGREESQKENHSSKKSSRFDVLPEDKIDHMKTEKCQSEGEAKENWWMTTRSTDESKVSTDEQVEGTEEINESSKEIFESILNKQETRNCFLTPLKNIHSTPTSMTFGDDETIATLLLNYEKSQSASNEKEKPLPKIDPKDKGKKKIKEEDESDDIPQAEKKFKQLESDDRLARKIQEDWEAEEERNDSRIRTEQILAEKASRARKRSVHIEGKSKGSFMITMILRENSLLDKIRGNRNRPPSKSKKFEDIQAMYEKIKRSDEDFIAIGSVEDDRLIKKMNKKDSSKGEEIKQESKEEVKKRS
ncbi:hypothetical protein Tco_0708815 [Tanacetum coccineum]